MRITGQVERRLFFSTPQGYHIICPINGIERRKIVNHSNTIEEALRTQTVAALVEFIQRAASEKATPEEVEALPGVAGVLMAYFIAH